MEFVRVNPFSPHKSGSVWPFSRISLVFCLNEFQFFLAGSIRRNAERYSNKINELHIFMICEMKIFFKKKWYIYLFLKVKQWLNSLIRTIWWNIYRNDFRKEIKKKNLSDYIKNLVLFMRYSMEGGVQFARWWWWRFNQRR